MVSIKSYATAQVLPATSGKRRDGRGHIGDTLLGVGCVGVACGRRLLGLAAEARVQCFQLFLRAFFDIDDAVTCLFNGTNQLVELELGRQSLS